MIVRLLRLREREHAHQDSNTGGLGAKQACVRLKNVLHAFRSHISLSHRLHLTSVTWSFVLDVITCNMICRCHENPTNGPTCELNMVRLP